MASGARLLVLMSASIAVAFFFVYKPENLKASESLPDNFEEQTHRAADKNSLQIELPNRLAHVSPNQIVKATEQRISHGFADPEDQRRRLLEGKEGAQAGTRVQEKVGITTPAVHNAAADANRRADLRTSTEIPPRIPAESSGTGVRAEKLGASSGDKGGPADSQPRVFEKVLPNGRAEQLQAQIHRATLQDVRLGGGSSRGARDAAARMQCYSDKSQQQPAACPAFSSCGPQFPGNQACSDPEFHDTKAEPFPWGIYRGGRAYFPGTCLPGFELETNGSIPFDCPDPLLLTPQDWSGQVFLLRNVFVNQWGQVFNQTHYFDTGGCYNDTEFEYPAGLKVLHYERLVNLIAPSSDPSPSFSLSTILPLLFSMRRLLPSLKGSDTPIALGELKVHLEPLEKLYGLRLMGPGQEKGDELVTLYHVDTLVQPLLPHCLSPSSSVWRRLRSSHLLLPTGLPIFHPTSWRQRVVPGAPPPGAPPPPARLKRDEWVVILVKPLGVERRLADFSWVEARLRETFGSRVVLYGPKYLPLLEAKSLFNRAALLVSLSSSSALSNLIFLPFDAMVLELRPPNVEGFSPPVLTPTEKFFHRTMSVRTLSHAAGLRHNLFVLGRPGRGGQGDVVADTKSFLALLQRLHQGMYMSYQGLLDGVPHPGTHIHTATTRVPAGPSFSPPVSVRSFDNWMDCVVSTGKWVPDPQPRVLAWPANGGLSHCDLKRYAEGHLIGWDADAQVFSGGVSPAEWDVRPEIKWKWAVDGAQCGAWEEFSAEKLCKQIQPRGLSIAVVGDSLSRNFVESFASLLSRERRLEILAQGPPYPKWGDPWAMNRTFPSQCREWMSRLAPQEVEKWDGSSACVTFEPLNGFCPGLRLHMLRSDMLTLDGTPTSFHAVPWVSYGPLADADVVVLNTGAHYFSDALHERNVQSAVHFLRHNFPDKLIVYRATAAGHVRCDDFHGPINEPQDLSSVHKNWGWTRFAGENKRAKQIVDAIGGMYMDVEYMTSLRPDGHNGFVKEQNLTDCLHYCTPGPLDVWSQMLYNILRRYLALAPSDKRA